jgi:transglutaminase-like putative cysteine protease
MRFRIRHNTRFEYERPAFESHNEVRLRPWDSAAQHCLGFSLNTDPPAAVLAHIDFFGNHTHTISISGPHDALTIVAESAVEMVAAPSAEYAEVSFSRFLTDDGSRAGEFYEFLGPSRYVPFSERLRKFFWMGARPRGTEDVAEYVMRVVAYVRDQFAYEAAKTHVHSSINDILKSGGGVCQDFAHLTIGLLRLAGVPARYVSGYLAPLPGARQLGEQASHAWLEAWLPGPGWTGFDPTHRCRTDQRHIGMAIGRDYGDVPPIHGTYRSLGEKSKMRVQLNIERTSESEPDAVAQTRYQSQQ